VSELNIILLIPILYFAYKGFKNGLIVELCSLVALILGVFVTISFSDVTYALLQENFPNLSTGLSILSYVITFVVVVIAVRLMGKLITKLVDAVALSFVNKTLGSLFGAFKAVVFLALLSILFESLNNKWQMAPDTYTDESEVYQVVKLTGATMQSVFSEAGAFTGPIQFN
jgi:membrane protein required for colicin V production